MTTAVGLADAIGEAEAELVQALELWPLALDPDLAEASGTWKGQPLRIATRAYEGERVHYARFATVLGQELEIGNLLCLPDPVYPVPVLGADLVGIRRDLAMFAADLSLTVPAGPRRQALIDSLVERRSTHRVPDGGSLPAWCDPWFSAGMLYTRVSAAEIPAAHAAFREYPRFFVDLLRTAEPDPQAAPETLDLQQRYLAAHRIDDKGLGLLAKLFSPQWAERYLAEVLFPIPSVVERPGGGTVR